jgi:hypothetical protein
MAWNSHITPLLLWSRKYYSSQAAAKEANMEDQWKMLISNCKKTWEKLNQGVSVVMEFEDIEDYEEEQILQQEELEQSLENHDNIYYQGNDSNEF